mmetsp:Transcript_63815/g.88087  ORF Transcript_63815/g.88087 Transcript_63815/m.88087 type:complete len:91 (+) Transcript_63815:64-336(+)
MPQRAARRCSGLVVAYVRGGDALSQSKHKSQSSRLQASSASRDVRSSSKLQLHGSIHSRTSPSATSSYPRREEQKPCIVEREPDDWITKM